ncbi:MAG: hypothetical protein ACOC2N_01195 [Spirochaetota bacterium]
MLPFECGGALEYYSDMEGVVLILMAAVVIVLILTLVRLGRGDYRLLADRMARKTRDNFEVLKPCPLCGSMLRRGETVHSVVFSGPAHAGSIAPGTAARKPLDRQIDDYLAHLFGCPYCHPANDEHPRRCPACSRTIPPSGYVIARMFEKPGRKHVHVLGCTECRTRRR